MNKPVYSILICVTAAVFCFSCSETHTAPPFVISEPVCKTGRSPGQYAFAGIEFGFYNTSKYEVSSIETVCTVFKDITGQNPFIGSNTVSAEFKGRIYPQESKQFSISLDAYIYTIPQKPFLIDHFYISKITYSNGQTWKDIFGFFSTGRRTQK